MMKSWIETEPTVSLSEHLGYLEGAQETEGDNYHKEIEEVKTELWSRSDYRHN